jgi:hypothetical protein
MLFGITGLGVSPPGSVALVQSKPYRPFGTGLMRNISTLKRLPDSGFVATLLLTICFMGVFAAVSRAGETPPPAVTEQIDAAVPAGPDDIVIGAYINSIQDIDFQTNSFSADLYVWFRWKNKDLDPGKSMEFMNRYAPDDHVRDSLYDAPQPMPDGSFYSIVRNQGRFSTVFQLANFPFDQQSLIIEVEDSTGGVGKQRYVPDTAPVTINSAIMMPGFLLGAPQIKIVENLYPTNFGDLTVGEAEAYSRATFVIPISRPVAANSVKTFGPIFLITACALLVLLVRPMFVDGRIGLGITALLTLVALQLTSGAALPDVEYLMLLDKVYLASYALIMLVLTRVVKTSWQVANVNLEASAARWDRVWAVFLLTAYVVAVAAIAWTSLNGLKL